MIVTRRLALSVPLLATIACTTPAHKHSPDLRTGNPLHLPMGVCDPQIRIYDDVAWLYATHDANPTSRTFTMNDWQIWRSEDLANWSHEGTLLPEDTYFGRQSSQCWATDAARRNNRYFLYFSMGPENIGVVVSDTPAGPWRDPLGKALIAKGQTQTESRDPGIFQEKDGTSYIVFGTFDYFIARLNEDMISLAEPPQRISIQDPQGPYGSGKTDDKPYLHRRGNLYYLSWGSYYGIGTSPYGPFQCMGALFKPENVELSFLNDSSMRGRYAPPPGFKPKDWLNFDRHGSFFYWRGRWFFACNDQSQAGTTPMFRQSVICNVRYLRNGAIAPLKLSSEGVTCPRR